MAGHSKWSQIRHKKALSDAKKSQVFSKLSRLISVAAREKGGNPEKNPKLRLIAEKARAMNMPQENISRAIQRGTGELPETAIEEAMYEGYGPGGAAVLIEVITDNKNRTLSEIRRIFEESGGKLAKTGSVKWLFNEVGMAALPQESWNDELAMQLIDIGAVDIKKEDGYFSIYVPVEKLESVKILCEKRGIKITDSGLEFVPSSTMSVEDSGTKERLEKLFETLDEHPDVKEIYSNAAL